MPTIPKLSKLFFGAVCLLFYTTSQAQEEEIKTSGLSLDALFNIEITIASKTEEKIPDAPSSVTVFTRQEIEDMGISSLRELLNFVPGFQNTLVTLDGPTQAVTPRGRFRTSISPDALFLIDGQRLNETHTGGASAFSRLISLGNVKQVEIIRGPGSALYGSNAFLGVVNVVTVTGLNEVTFRGGENNSREARLHFSDTIGPVQFSVFGSYYKDDGQSYILPPNIENDNETQDPKEKNDLSLTLEYKNFTLRSRFQERIFEDFFNFDTVTDGVNQNKTWQTSFNLQYRILESDKWKMTAAYHYMRTRWTALAEFATAEGLGREYPFRAGPYFRLFDNNITLDLDYRPNDRHQFIAGIFFRRPENDLVRSISTYSGLDPINGEPSPTPILDDSVSTAEKSRDITGAYIQDKITFNDLFTLFVGARFDNYKEDETTYSTFNPRGGLIYKTPAEGRLKLLYGSAFRAPSFAELYITSPITVENLALEPEEIQTIELVYIQDFSDSARLALTLFDNDIDQAIVQVIVDETGRFRNENKGTATYTGGELEFTFAPTEDWLFKSTYTHIFDSERLAPDVDPASATSETFEHYGSIIVNYQTLDWNFNFNGIYRSKIQDFKQQSSYFVGNAKVRYRVNSKIYLDLTAHNVFDEDFATFGETNVLLGGAIPNRGRELGLGLNIKY